MGLYLTPRELAETEPADEKAFRSPVPTQIVSNGEFNPMPQTPQQRAVEATIKAIAAENAARLGWQHDIADANGVGGSLFPQTQIDQQIQVAHSPASDLSMRRRRPSLRTLPSSIARTALG